MKSRHLLALCGATLAVVLAPAVAFAATKVSVRVEGAAKTLLAPTSVSVPGSGSITKGGTPSGACPRSSAAGALDAATGHRWAGKYYASVPGIFISSIFGEKPTGNFYWTVFVNNQTSALGVCAVKLHRGDQLLFAVTNGSQAPIVLTGPSRLRVGRTATVSTGYYAAGRLKPLAGVHVHGGGVSAVSDRHGRVRIPITHSGTLVLRADEHGYIRAAPLRLRELP
jgi:hypothetical protein